jgi:RNA polymerase sigma-70 factor, ECF subfamily
VEPTQPRSMPQPDSSPEQAAVDRLMPLVYDELRALAERYLRGRGIGQTLQPTGLVHEAYVRLLEQRRVDWQGRTHFFRIAAQAMRRVLVDYARSRLAQKRGGGEVRVTLADLAVVAAPAEVDILAVDRALSQLEAADPQQARVVELRFFAGLTIDETAEALAISAATVKREWSHARAWLLAELGGR